MQRIHSRIHTHSAPFQSSARLGVAPSLNAQSPMSKPFSQQNPHGHPYRSSRMLATPPQSSPHLKVKPRIPNIMFDHTRVPMGYARLPAGKGAAADNQAQQQKPEVDVSPNLSTFATAQQWKQMSEWLASVGRKIDCLLYVALRDGWTRAELISKLNKSQDRPSACLGYLVVCRSRNDEVFGGYHGTPRLFVSPHKHRSQYVDRLLEIYITYHVGVVCV